MIKFLSKIFIRDRENIHSPAVRSAYGALCGIVGIILNIILFSAKLIAGTVSGAISVTADAFNNLSDAGSSVITLLGFRMSEKKPDRGHPFGHGRIEYISGLIVSMIIIIVGFELGKTSIDKIISPENTEFSILTIVILASSVLVKAYMAFYNFKIGKKISSSAMTATATDSLSDCIATVAVLISCLISHFFSVNIDAYCGLAVSLFILVSGFRAAKETIDPLLGSAPSTEIINKIREIVFSHKEVLGMHDLIIHDYGPGRMMISLHAEVSANADLVSTHDMIDNIEKELQEKLKCNAVIHMDPIVNNDAATNQTRELVSELLKDIDKRITIHDFRMVAGPTHTNIIFDVTIPCDIKKTEKELLEEIEKKVKSIDENYYSIANIDTVYV